MPQNDFTAAGTQLSELLMAEQQYIRDANFQAMAELTVEKEALFEKVGSMAKDKDTARKHKALLTRIAQQAQRNQMLMEAAQKGVRAAQNRYAAMMRAQFGLTTYDQQGRVENQIKPLKNLEKLA